MALTFSLIDTWDDGKRIHVSGTIAASGNYTTGGDTLDLSQSPVVASAQPPINGTAWMDGLAGYDYVFKHTHPATYQASALAEDEECGECDGSGCGQFCGVRFSCGACFHFLLVL
jgi:hypothetical protein